jgi:hypothetical protein
MNLSLPRRRRHRLTRYATRYAKGGFVTDSRNGLVTAVTPPGAAPGAAPETSQDADTWAAIAASHAAQSAAGLTW